MVLMLLTRIAENPSADVLTGVGQGVLRRGKKELPCPGSVGWCGGRQKTALYGLQ